jgi:type II secretory pathway pseudopilin PulG
VVTRSPRAGLTIVEVLVALVIFSGGVLALAEGLSRGARTIVLAGDRARAASLLGLRLERLRAQGAGGCGGMTGGGSLAASRPVAMNEVWRLSPVLDGRGLEAQVVISWARDGRLYSDSLTAVLPC